MNKLCLIQHGQGKGLETPSVHTHRYHNLASLTLNQLLNPHVAPRLKSAFSPFNRGRLQKESNCLTPRYRARLALTLQGDRRNHHIIRQTDPQKQQYLCYEVPNRLHELWCKTQKTRRCAAGTSLLLNKQTRTSLGGTGNLRPGPAAASGRSFHRFRAALAAAPPPLSLTDSRGMPIALKERLSGPPPRPREWLPRICSRQNGLHTEGCSTDAVPARPNREPQKSRSGPEAALPKTTLRSAPHLPPLAQTPRSAPPTVTSQSQGTTRRAPAPAIHSEPIGAQRGWLSLPIGAHPGEPTASARAGGFKNGPILINGPRRRGARMRSPARRRCYGSTGRRHHWAGPRGTEPDPKKRGGPPHPGCPPQDAGVVIRSVLHAEL